MAKYMPEKRFSFSSSAASLNEETFGVVQFTGVEGISLPYEFDITLVSDNPEIDLDKIMAVPARFTIHRDEGDDVNFHGILDSFEQLHKYNEFIFYRVHFMPRLRWLSITHHNQVCLGKTVPQIIELALKDSGLTTLDFEFRLQRTYEPVEYACQYNESHFNFVSRWLEREGIYYFFDQKGPVEKIIFTDTYIAHTDLSDVHYTPPAGFVEEERTEIVNSFICRQRQLPRKIHLKDYNYERPSLGISGSADVDAQGRGTDYIYGEFFPTSEEGDRLAALRAETLNCRKREFTGESTVPFLEPGYTFTLHRHYRDSFNGKYLVESVSHEGNQVGYLLPEVAEGLKGYKSTVYYRNSFSAIPAEVQFRPERKAVKPRISGTMHAVIDAAGSGRYAELDNQGRYKVRLPFDESDDHKAGKASIYLRMMQPYANRKGGMQFPLTKGTEVLLTFIDGDPDRPVIAGAIANPETPSPVSNENQTESVIQTGGNNKIRIEDKEGKERIIMESPTAGSWVRIGAPNDPPPPEYVEDKDSGNGIRIRTDGRYWLESSRYFGEYVGGMPLPASDNVPGDLMGLLTKVRNDGWAVPDVDPNEDSNFCEKSDSEHANCKDVLRPTNIAEPASGFESDDTTDEKKWKRFLDQANVRLIEGDMLTIQNGCQYDLTGNMYAFAGGIYNESHVSWSPVFNKKYENTIGGSSFGVGQIVGVIVGGSSALLTLVGGIVSTVTVVAIGVTAKAPLAGVAVIPVVTGGITALVGVAISMIAGNVYTEAKRLQGVNTGDILDGPMGDTDKDIQTWAKKVGTSVNQPSGGQEEGENTGGTNVRFLANGDNPMKTSTTWVEKKIGDTYDFQRGNGIEVKVGNFEAHSTGDSYEYQYGGIKESSEYSSDGYLLKHEYSCEGNQTTHIYDSLTKQLCNFQASAGPFTFEAKIPQTPTINGVVNTSPLDMNFEFVTGASLDVAIRTTPITVDVALGLGLKFEGCLAGQVAIDVSTGEADFNAFYLKAKKEAKVKAEQAEFTMNKMQLNMAKCMTKAYEGDIDIEKIKLILSVHDILFQ